MTQYFVAGVRRTSTRPRYQTRRRGPFVSAHIECAKQADRRQGREKRERAESCVEQGRIGAVFAAYFF
jgi:hypothetical protein